MKIIIAYHKYCRDGWAAAAVAYDHYVSSGAKGDIVFFPLLPDNLEMPILNLIKKESCKTKIVFFDIGFSDYSLMIKLMDHFDDIYIADHHKTTRDMIYERNGWEDDEDVIRLYHKGVKKVLLFDNNKCGAVLAWEYYYPDSDVPKLLKYIQDRDLWTKRMPSSKIINLGLYEMLSCDFTNHKEVNNVSIWSSTEKYPGFLNAKMLIPNFEKWIKYMKDNSWGDEALLKGKILDGIQTRERIKLEKSAKLVKWKGMMVYFCNNAGVQTSDVSEDLYMRKNREGNYLCDFVLLWRFNHKENICCVGLRSRAYSDVDVSRIAKEYGGGGHKHASGFTCSMETMTTIFKNIQPMWV